MKKPVKFNAVLPLLSPVRRVVLKRVWDHLPPERRSMDRGITYMGVRSNNTYYQHMAMPNPCIDLLRKLLDARRVPYAEKSSETHIAFTTEMGDVTTGT